MILFEGNVAAGKSEAGKRLVGKRLREILTDTGFIEEPVGAWQTEFEENLLDLFYRDQRRWAFTFQLAAFTTRAKTWTEILALDDHSRVLLERSIYCDRYVFARNCFDSGIMKKTEWQLYCKMWDWLQMNWCTNPDRIIYLRTTAEKCLSRIWRRKRPEEMGVPLAYLVLLEMYHDGWLLGIEDMDQRILEARELLNGMTAVERPLLEAMKQAAEQGNLEALNELKKRHRRAVAPFMTGIQPFRVSHTDVRFGESGVYLAACGKKRNGEENRSSTIVIDGNVHGIGNVAAAVASAISIPARS